MSPGSGVRGPGSKTDSVLRAEGADDSHITASAGPRTPDPGPRTPANQCRHCGIPSSDEFCCSGCATAFAIIHGAGLEGWLVRREPGTPVAAITVPEAWGDPAFLAKQVTPLADGRACLTWAVEGVHCPACVWLLERLPALQDGVSHARLDMARMSLRVTYDPRTTSPLEQARLVARLGYRLLPYRSPEELRRRTRERRDLLLRLALAGAAAVGSMHLSMNVYAGAMTGDLPLSERHLFAWGALAAALPAVWAAGPWWSALGRSLRQRRWSADALAAASVALGLGVTFISLVTGGTALYADAVAMFVALLLVGRVVLATVQERIRDRAGRLEGLLPATARRAGEERMVSAEALVPGEVVEVRPGERLPCDGVAQAGEVWLDTAVLTGEATPTPIAAGAPVYAGTVVARGILRLRVEAIGTASRLAGILAQAEATQTSAHDPWAGRYVRMALGAVGLGAVVLVILGLPWGTVLERSLAALLASCPCAVGLALPILRARALAGAAAKGVLIADEAALDRLPDCRTAILDKTGTLTTGQATRVEWTWFDGIDRRALVGRAEQGARHPLAAVLATAEDLPALAVTEFPGQGVEARFADGILRVGSAAFTGVDLPDDAALAAGIAWNGLPVGLVRADDPLRPEAAAVVADLRQQGLTTILASGDRPGPCRRAAEACGITDLHPGCTPEDKAALVQRHPHVLMIGDGVNDALALAAAEVAIGVRGGLAAALRCCHVYLLDPARALTDLTDLLALARRHRRHRHLLLAWAWGYNALALGCALAGVWGPLVCAVGMPLSSLVAVGLAVGLEPTSRIDGHREHAGGRR